MPDWFIVFKIKSFFSDILSILDEWFVCVYMFGYPWFYAQRLTPGEFRGPYGASD